MKVSLPQRERRPQICRICGKHEDILLTDLCQRCFERKHPELDFANDEERSWAEAEPHLEEEQRDRPRIS